jgi:fatty acid desaturase
VSATTTAPPHAASLPHAAAASDATRFVRDAQALVRDLLVPDVARYSIDFLASIAVAYAAFVVYLRADAFSAVHIAAFLACGVAMFRAVAFTHELTHRRGRGFKAFTVAWNVLCGIPFLVPSFLYGDHGSHHANHAYGTWADPEYLVRRSGSRIGPVIFLLLPVVYPALPVVRFLILTPLAAVSGNVNRLVWTYGSSLYIMNESYRRELDGTASSPARWVQEIACAAWVWTIALLVLSQRVPWSVVARTYLVFFFWIAINQVRTLAAHRYDNDPASPMTYVDQLLDTNTFPRGVVLPNLWAPLGLRYHALHHLIPSMPYHAMGRAHRRLMAHLPEGSPYHRTVRPGLWPVLVSMLRRPDAGTPL